MISDGGKLCIGNNSDLLGNLNEDPDQDPPVYCDAKFLDGAAVVYLLPVTNIPTFDDYAHQIFIPHVIKQWKTPDESMWSGTLTYPTV